jgi:hypothetical protein
MKSRKQQQSTIFIQLTEFFIKSPSTPSAIPTSGESIMSSSISANSLSWTVSAVSPILIPGNSPLLIEAMLSSIIVVISSVALSTSLASLVKYSDMVDRGGGGNYKADASSTVLLVGGNDKLIVAWGLDKPKNKIMREKK